MAPPEIAEVVIALHKGVALKPSGAEILDNNRTGVIQVETVYGEAGCSRMLQVPLKKLSDKCRIRCVVPIEKCKPYRNRSPVPGSGIQ